MLLLKSREKKFKSFVFRFIYTPHQINDRPVLPASSKPPARRDHTANRRTLGTAACRPATHTRCLPGVKGVGDLMADEDDGSILYA